MTDHRQLPLWTSITGKNTGMAIHQSHIPNEVDLFAIDVVNGVTDKNQLILVKQTKDLRENASEGGTH